MSLPSGVLPAAAAAQAAGVSLAPGASGVSMPELESSALPGLASADAPLEPPLAEPPPLLDPPGPLDAPPLDPACDAPPSAPTPAGDPEHITSPRGTARTRTRA